MKRTIIYWKWSKGWQTTSWLFDVVTEYYDQYGNVEFAVYRFGF